MIEDKPVAIVLGGTNPHKAVIQSLKTRGYYTILVDYLENPAAKAVADVHIRESTLDLEVVLQIAKENNAALVIAICIDQANATACYVAEKLGLPIPYTYQTAVIATDKAKMKKRMAEYAIPTSKYYAVTNLDIPEFDLQFPVVVKPADTTGSKGVKKAFNFEEINKYLIDALRLSRTNTAIVEEFKEGLEVQIDCFVRDKVVHILMLNQKNKVALDGDFELQSVGSTIPAQISDKALDNIKIIANKLVEAFDFDNTPFFMQTIVSGDEVNVIEFAPRIGGGLSYRIINLYSGFDTLNHALDFYVNDEKELEPVKRDFYFSTNNLYTESGTFGDLEGYEELLKDGVIEEFYRYKTSGTIIGSQLSSNNRVGAFIVKAETKHELHEKMSFAYSNIRVFDTDGNAMIVRNLGNIGND
ncbi:MAG: ATP-grasp domain-containing protein [Flavobacterium sp.]|nr:MAG: ATP-grasp domain-containing protein [Flavobacterium sp.]